MKTNSTTISYFPGDTAMLLKEQLQHGVCFHAAYLDDIQTHVNDMFCTGAVVSGSGVTL